MKNENRSMLATLVIWALIAVGVMTVLAWVLPSAFSLMGAALWFFVGFFVGRHTMKKNNMARSY